MCDDLWPEYRLECAVREREDLPFVSLPEFATMRDWTDRLDEPRDPDRWNEHERDATFRILDSQSTHDPSDNLVSGVW
ncbi:MAG: hypothetical protein M3008_00450 [Chloroflexota bacterium]|nr:hypothetical protein [Chloroflexota bacterium]